MSNDKSYQGWTNYETWAVALWLDNDQGSYEYWRDVAEEIKEDEGDEDDEDIHLAALASRLKDEFEEGMPDLGASLWSDLLGAALSEVNWYEIAKSKYDE